MSVYNSLRKEETRLQENYRSQRFRRYEKKNFKDCMQTTNDDHCPLPVSVNTPAYSVPCILHLFRLTCPRRKNQVLVRALDRHRASKSSVVRQMAERID